MYKNKKNINDAQKNIHGAMENMYTYKHNKIHAEIDHWKSVYIYLYLHIYYKVIIMKFIMPYSRNVQTSTFYAKLKKKTRKY